MPALIDGLGGLSRYRSAFVTGGAGFIGSRLVGKLSLACDSVTVYDSLLEQVHGTESPAVAGLKGVRLTRGDVRDGPALGEALRAAEPDLIVHLAAETGTGQSWDELSRYTGVNVTGTALLVEAIRTLPPSAAKRRVLLASSRAIYGEGAYLDRGGRLVFPPPRRRADLIAGRFDLYDDQGEPMRPTVTGETATAIPSSIYASTKLMQEYLLQQSLGSDIDLVVLRLQNVFGPGQSLINPYTGIISIFANQVMSGKTLNVYEDGAITRDFIYVDDVIDAMLAGIACPVPPSGPVNVGSGHGTTIIEVARQLNTLLGRSADAFMVSGDFRAGDVRHAVSDISKARAELGWRPRVPFEVGLRSFVEWSVSAGGAETGR